jgi:hypothetical protein
VRKLSAVPNVTGREMQQRGITDTRATPENGLDGWSFSTGICSFLKVARPMRLRRGVVHRALHVVVVSIGRLAGMFVASGPPPPMAPSHHYSCSGGCSGQRSVAASLLLVFVLVVVVALAVGAALGLSPSVGLAFSPFNAWATRKCQARPSATLAHLSTRLKSAETSWMSWVATFSNIFSSLTP